MRLAHTPFWLDAQERAETMGILHSLIRSVYKNKCSYCI